MFALALLALPAPAAASADGSLQTTPVDAATNRLSSTKISYDSSSNITSQPMGMLSWGYDYDPFDMLRHVTLPTGGGFIASSGLIPTFNIVNRSDVQASIEGAELSVDDVSYEAELPGNGELHWRSVDPGQSGSISAELGV
jgi:hypothetical protein